VGGIVGETKYKSGGTHLAEQSFKFKESFYKAIADLNEKQIGKLLKGICEYAYSGKEFVTKDVTLGGAFTLIKTALDEDKAQAEVSEKRKGGFIAMVKETAEGEVRFTAELGEQTCSLERAIGTAFVALNMDMGKA